MTSDTHTYLTAFTAGTQQPTTWNLNAWNGTTAALSMVTPGANGAISIYSAGRTHLLVDVIGWIEKGTKYEPVPPVRMLDTRSGIGARQATVPAGGSVDVRLTDAGLVPAAGVSAVAVSVTAAGPESFGSMAVYPTGAPRPATSGHTCAALTDGSLWCWGDNSSQQLATPGADVRPVPTRVTGIG